MSVGTGLNAPLKYVPAAIAADTLPGENSAPDSPPFLRISKIPLPLCCCCVRANIVGSPPPGTADIVLEVKTEFCGL